MPRGGLTQQMEKSYKIFMSEVFKNRTSIRLHQIHDCRGRICVPRVSEALDSCWDASA